MQKNEILVDPDYNFFCPVTGQLISGPETFGPSPATAFMLQPEADEFDVMIPELKNAWEKTKAANDGESSPWMLFDDFCKELEHLDNLVLFSLTSEGMACGPVSTTLHVCIDFAYGTSWRDDVDY